MKYFLCLGSNLGHRRKNLNRALALLEEKGIEILRLSSLYKTQPVGIKNQPWFYNQVAEIDAPYNPHTLLRVIKDIEKEMKREPTILRSPRPIDIDILLAGKTIVRTARLVIPHPRMHRRNFVLVPLKEISPGIVHSLFGVTIEKLHEISRDKSEVKKIGPPREMNTSRL